MKNKANKSDSVQGADSTRITPAMCKEYLIRDIGVAISCLKAIHDDPDLLSCMADFMVGRLENARHREELKKQQEIFENQPD